ncbi:MAG: ComEC/Rec2 family competence protein [Paracoccaceae bacterium]
MEGLKAFWRSEATAFPLWVPVLIGCGVQIYFWLPVEPVGWIFGFMIAAPFLLAALLWDWLSRAPLLGLALTLVILGFCVAGARARIVAAPVLPASIDATVEGVILEVTRTAAGRPRLVLDRLVIFGVDQAATPEKVQVSLLREAHLEGLRPGMRVSIFARLGPPGAPVEPGGFDFRRDAWFKSLGGVGFARGAPAMIETSGTPNIIRRLGVGLARARAGISAGLRAALPGETGAFAAAVTVGDRAGVDREATQALRDSNLSHLLAISGLHMGLVTAMVFGGVRLILAAVPYSGRRWRIKRHAAVVALLAATGYLLISGASIATQRAYVMAVVALVAVLVNRPAITLRALAVAATVILLIRPESLAHVGFQMSFAATAALIAGFDFARERGWGARIAGGGVAARVGGYVIALAATSLLAGLATAPFAAFHFNRVSNYGLIANLAAVPIMGFWVAPTALLAGFLAPLGLEHWALAVMGKGIDSIMTVARFVAGLDGASRGVAAAAPIVLTLITFGGLGLCLGRQVLRWFGVGLLAAGFALWLVWDVRPEALVAPEARLVGVLGPEGRALDHAKSQSYAARAWLERDGDDADQAAAAARPGFVAADDGSMATLSNGWKVVNLVGRWVEPARMNEFCEPRVLLLAPGASAPAKGPCQTFFGEPLRLSGALALEPDGKSLRVRSVAESSGVRFWTAAPSLEEEANAGAWAD